MHRIVTLACSVVFCLGVSTAHAAQITGEYLESRTCDVWTGPCFANAEMDLAGKEAVMAWKVDEGSWNNVTLDGLGVALVLNAERTLGTNGIFPMKEGKIRSVILVDEKAGPEQHAALIDFAKESAGKLIGKVVEVQNVPFELTNDHLAGRGFFKAGDLAEIETRALVKGDCICTNEITYYLPLCDVENYSPAFSKTNAYRGDALNNKWTAKHQRSAFLATFRR